MVNGSENGSIVGGEEMEFVRGKADILPLLKPLSAGACFSIYDLCRGGESASVFV